jgi:hypothetical protein
MIDLAARVEALRLSRNQVREELRSAGVKLNQISAPELNRLARIWLDFHAELIEREALRANLRSAAQREKAHSKRVSVVQISCSKVLSEQTSERACLDGGGW